MSETTSQGAGERSNGVHHAAPDNGNNNNNQFICGVVEGFYGKPWTFSQRRDLFKQLQLLNLNSFMYAPKGDAKHRSKWRQLYDESEARELRILIDEASAHGVDFYYSLAPGLDIVYSEPDDTKQLCRKFDQLKSLGCKSFALLFDDIEPNLAHEKDRIIFKNNYASAQVSVTNLIYNYLDRPKFLFCPTEYCESRAVPSVLGSLYLNTIGTGLHDGIDIMWSGSRVISRYITEESIKELNSVIRRRVLIWENLHANDYDKKRVYLGPYSGRSTRIIPHLRGVLTNPNCEYEANYIAIHTLAQWRHSSANSGSHNSNNNSSKCNQASGDFQSPPEHLEPIQDNPAGATKSECDDDCSVYDPDKALMRALRDWLPHMLSSRPIPTNSPEVCHDRNDDLACEQISKDQEPIATIEIEPELLPNNTTCDDRPEGMRGVDESNHEDIIHDEDMADEERSATGESSSLGGKSDMDTSVVQSQTHSPASPAIQMIDTNNSNSCDSCEMQEAPPSPDGQTGLNPDRTDTQTGPDGQVVGMTTIDCNKHRFYQQHNNQELNLDSLGLLVDFFYLPFEHGPRGSAFLNDIKWLIDHSVVFLNQEDGDAKKVDGDREDKKKLMTLWVNKAKAMNQVCASIDQTIDSLMHGCPNRLLMSELAPYLRNLHEALELTMSLLQFLQYRTSCLDRFYYNDEPKTKEPISQIDLDEPWAHKGGLVGDVQRLISSGIVDSSTATAGGCS